MQGRGLVSDPEVFPKQRENCELLPGRNEELEGTDFLPEESGSCGVWKIVILFVVFCIFLLFNNSGSDCLEFK